MAAALLRMAVSMLKVGPPGGGPPPPGKGGATVGAPVPPPTSPPSSADGALPDTADGFCFPPPPPSFELSESLNWSASHGLLSFGSKSPVGGYLPQGLGLFSLGGNPICSMLDVKGLPPVALDM